jgi:hypothetical protein
MKKQKAKLTITMGENVLVHEVGKQKVESIRETENGTVEVVKEDAIITYRGFPYVLEIDRKEK